MQGFLIVFAGSGIGGALRHGVNVGALRWFGPNYPAGTLAVNIAGSLLMGLIAGWFIRQGAVASPWRLFLTTGVLGGFTTFSAFSLDTVMLWERGAHGQAALYVGASVAMSLAALAAGLALMRA